MNSHKVSQAFRDFIERHFRIDSWGLNAPSNINDSLNPPSSAREEPVIDAIQTSGFFEGYGDGPALVEERFAFTITYLMGQLYSYEELLQRKRGAANIVKRMSFSVRQTPDCLGEEFHQIELNGTVILAQVENKDWWLVIKLMFIPTYEVEPENLDEIDTWIAADFDLDPSDRQESISKGVIKGLQSQINQLQKQVGNLQEGDDSEEPDPTPDETGNVQEAETDSAVVLGQPLYLKSSGHVDLASAATIGTARVCGLALFDAFAATSVGFSPDGVIELEDWTAVTDSATLTPGAIYFLSAEAGKLTTTAPTESGQVVLAVGTALSTIKLAIEIQLPFLL